MGWLMREIKFRAWNSKGKGMYYDVDLIGGLAAQDHSWLCYSEEDGVMQFTGLKDKNGEEIYEGDIVKWELRYPAVKGQFAKGIIVFHNSGFKIDKLGFSYQDERYYSIKNSEVIGNIYENPELVK